MYWTRKPPSLKPAIPYGPQCEGCPYRVTSIGFAPPSGAVESDECSGQYTLDGRATLMFVGEALGGEEMRQGRPFVGGAGTVLNRLMTEGDIRRHETVINNLVKCRPIVWSPDGTPALNTRGDYVNATPSPGQVRECASRYFQHDLDAFRGRTIIGLGTVPLQYFTSHTEITDYRGTVFMPGTRQPCEPCGSTGGLPRPDVKCKGCKGHKVVQARATAPCPDHPKWSGGRTKRACCSALRAASFDPCALCEGLGAVPRAPKKCPDCKGAGSTAVGGPHVSYRLREDQRFFPTLHPAYLMRVQGFFPAVVRDFKRILHLEEEEKAAEEIRYTEVPPDTWGEPPLYAYDRPWSVDIETTGLSPDSAQITMIGFSPGPPQAWVVPPNEPRARKVLAHASEIIGQNYLSFDAWWLVRTGFPAPKRLWDTRQAGHILNPDTRHNLITLAAEYAVPAAQGYWKAKIDYEKHLAKVCCMDADMTFRVRNGQQARLEETGQLHLMEKNRIPLSNVLLQMRVGGMRVDREQQEAFHQTLDTEIGELDLELQANSGVTSANSPPQVQNYLYNILRLPVQLERVSRRPTANEESLLDLARKIEIGHASVSDLTTEVREQSRWFIATVLRIRELSKLRGSFASHILDLDDLVHPALLPFTATGRLSCSGPNAQQVPPTARNMFVPDKAHGPDAVIVSADYSQIELILFLWEIEAWSLLSKLLTGEYDGHQLVAALMYNKELVDVTSIERRAGKTTNFAMIFGAAARSTAARLHMQVYEVQDWYDRYLASMPGIPEWREEKIHQVRSKGYVSSPFGWRRYFIPGAEIEGSESEMTKACNTPIQNGAAMITQRAMIDLERELPRPARLIMQVHDELVVSTPRDLLSQVAETMRGTMTQVIPEVAAPVLRASGGLRFPITIKSGPNWRDVTKEAV